MGGVRAVPRVKMNAGVCKGVLVVSGAGFPLVNVEAEHIHRAGAFSLRQPMYQSGDENAALHLMQAHGSAQLRVCGASFDDGLCIRNSFRGVLKRI